MRDLLWSNQEKVIARKVFDQALQREFAAVIAKAKQLAGKIDKPADLWKLEDYLRRSRKKIDEKYDYSYSVLPVVFASLVLDGRLTEEELQGLGDDKLAMIHAYLHIYSDVHAGS